jgi:hypothetical protein
MNEKSAKRIRKHVKIRNPGLILLLSEEYGQGIYDANPKQMYKKAKKLYKKKPFLQEEVLKLGVKVIQEEIAKEKSNDVNEPEHVSRP